MDKNLIVRAKVVTDNLISPKFVSDRVLNAQVENVKNFGVNVSDADARASDVLIGKTFYSSSSNKRQEGTLNPGDYAPIQTISLNGEKIVPDELRNINIIITKEYLGLNKVDNTSDLDKPISKVQQEKFNSIDLEILNLKDLVSKKANSDKIPTKTSQLENDSKFVTINEIQNVGGKIDSISVNGENVEVINKNVNIEIPKTTEELTNNSGFITSSVDNLLNYYNKTETDTKIEVVKNLIPSINGLASETFVTTKDQEILAGAKAYTNEKENALNAEIAKKADKTSLSLIEEKIPTTASSTNKLADIDFVNSSIATNTATFRGTVNNVSELPTTGVDLNDYSFVKSIDEAGNTLYQRYKYNGSKWEFEYSLNNSTFTSAQWETINSGITKSYIDDKNNLQDTEINNIKLDISGLSNVAKTGSYNDLKDKPTIPTVPTKLSELINDSGFITADSVPDFTETDPTVPAWAKAANKPVYSYNEITDKPTLFSGDYNDLTNKPSIPSVPTNYVTTDTKQTISGEKAFTQPIAAKSGIDVTTPIYGVSGSKMVQMLSYDYSKTGEIVLGYGQTPLEIRSSVRPKVQLGFESEGGTKEDMAYISDLNREIIVDTSGDVNATLSTNVKYNFTGTLTTLNLTLGQPTTGTSTKYACRFYVGDTIPTVTCTPYSGNLIWNFATLDMLMTYTFYELEVVNNIATLIPIANRYLIFKNYKLLTNSIDAGSNGGTIKVIFDDDGNETLDTAAVNKNYTITATPNTNFELVSLTNNGVAITNGSSYKATSDFNLLATFKGVSTTLTYNVPTGATVKITDQNGNVISSGGTVNYYDRISISVTAQTGYSTSFSVTGLTVISSPTYRVTSLNPTITVTATAS